MKFAVIPGTIAGLCACLYAVAPAQAETKLFDVSPLEGVDYVRPSSSSDHNAHGPSRLDQLFSSESSLPAFSPPTGREPHSPAVLTMNEVDVATHAPLTLAPIRFNAEQFYPKESGMQTDMRWQSPRPAKATTRHRFGDLIARIAQEEAVDEHLLHAVISVESGYDHLAVSPKGAMGLMQLMPATAARFGATNPDNPLQNLRAGARYLKFLKNMYNGDLSLVLAAYNAGEGNVSKYNNRIPPFAETRTYVSKVLHRYQGANPDTRFELSNDGRMGWFTGNPAY